MAQTFRFLDLPKELRFMVYEQLATRSHIVAAPDHLFQVSLIGQDPLPPIHQTCSLLQAEAGPFIDCHRGVSPPPRVIFDLVTADRFLPFYGLVDTFVSTLHKACSSMIGGFTPTECHDKLQTFVHEFFRSDPGDPEYKWIQHNEKVLMQWCLSFHNYWKHAHTSNFVLEVALLGAVVSDAELKRFLGTVELDLFTETWVHLYEVASGSHTPCRQLPPPRGGTYPQLALYKGIVDQEEWHQNRA